MSGLLSQVKEIIEADESQRIHLELVHPERSIHAKTEVSYLIKNDCLYVHFRVPCPVLSAKLQFEEGDFPYNYDVTEVFITADDITQQNFSYFEFEVTPYKQIYHLRIDFKEGVRQPGVMLDTQTLTDACIFDGGWETCFMISLHELGILRGRLKGNFFSIVGSKPRTYWSAFLPQQEVANFHKPEFFKPLF